jgi:hypothetical protein
MEIQKGKPQNDIKTICGLYHICCFANMAQQHRQPAYFQRRRTEAG